MKINREIKARNLTNMKQCKAGVEIHFANAGGCREQNSKTRRKRGSLAGPCGICIGTCNSIEASY